MVAAAKSGRAKKPAAKKPRAKAAPKTRAKKSAEKPDLHGASLYTPEIADAILERLSQGEYLRAICRTEGMPTERTVRRWVVDDVCGFAPLYTRARDEGVDARFESLPELAREARGKDAAEVNAIRLQLDVEKWAVAKLAPKRYGDRLELSGEINHHHYLHLERGELLEKAEEKLRQLGLLKE